MSSVETEARPATVGDKLAPAVHEVASHSATSDEAPGPSPGEVSRRRLRILPLLITLVTIGLAAVAGKASWDAYMGAPWTRDGTVRAYIVTMAPQVAGQIVKLPVVDNEFVHKGDLLMVIDPTDYKIAVDLAQAAVEHAQVTARNAQREAQGRQELTRLAVTKEEQQTYKSTAIADLATYNQAVANLNQARVNLQRTEIRSPVNGYVTNLLAQLGDYATVGENLISLVDADSYWVDGYFEETSLSGIRKGDPAMVKLMGYSQPVRGHVASIARAINVANAQPNDQGVATVNPIFTWVRLAQRIPARIHIDKVPHGMQLVAGMTATVQIDPPPEKNARKSRPSRIPRATAFLTLITRRSDQPNYRRNPQCERTKNWLLGAKTPRS